MKNKRFSEEKIIQIIKEHDGGIKAEDLCRNHGIAQSTLYKWKSKFGGLGVNEAKRLRELESENTKLKKLLAEAMLDNAVLKDVVSKNLSFG